MGIDRRKAQRILAVQNRMHEIAEWKLAAIQQARAEAERQRQALIGTLNEEQHRALLVDIVARRLRKLAVEEQRLAAEAVLQSARVREQGMRLKRAEHLAERADTAAQQAQNKTALDDVLEAFIVAGKASFPPA